MNRRQKNNQSSAQDSLSVAVISDIHAYQGLTPDQAPSHCCVTENDATKNPLVSLRDFISAEKLTANLLMCPGDLGDKAHPVAIQHVWRELHCIRDLLKATMLIPTAGNHDVDSRHVYNHFDAKGLLQSLEPSFPFADERLNDQYWSRHFVILRGPTYRILVLNSSAFHGEGRIDTTSKHEYEQGRISEYTLNRIRKELQSGQRVPINICLCHHHLHPHSELRLGESDLMMGGQALLQLLENSGRWLVIHGHKHHPKLQNAAGSASSPIVFAAGSLAAVFHGELQTAARNQFYVLEFPNKHYDQFGFVGRFRSWDWLSGHGWIPAKSNLPANGGFGWRGDLGKLSREIAGEVRRRAIQWPDLVSKIKSLAYLSPVDLEQLVKLLRDDRNLIVQPEDAIPPTLIGRP